MTIRPSTTRLDLNLRALVAELSRRDLGCTDVSRLLGCSPSSARNYIARLLDAGIIGPRRGASAGGRATILYRLRPDADLSRLDRLAEAAAPAAPGDDTGAGDEVQGEPDAAGARPGLRDPLVAAFFGRPAPRSEHA
jgi:hypothetical protein